MPNLQDRRVRKTRNQLRLAVSTLLAQKPINRITVKELCEIVDINRATFYSHYQDVYDLVEKTEEDFCKQFEILTAQHPIDQTTVDFMPLYQAIFEMLLEEKELATALFCGNGGYHSGQRILFIFKDYFEYQWQHLAPEDYPIKQEYAFSYILSGCTGTIQAWLNSGAKETPEEMATMLSYIVRNGIINHSI